ncbi:MAG: NAD(P)H-hydrate dehydratase [Rhodospirillales bacterium]
MDDATAGMRQTALMELLTTDEMYRADRLATEAGISGIELMQRAGQSVADVICRRWLPRPAVILCGPGNNGGDGFVVARLLAGAGWPVRVLLLGDRQALRGDAAHHAGLWPGPVVALGPDHLNGGDLIVDALFGAGLTRALSGTALDTIRRVSDLGLDVVAVDMPSGVDGNTGAVPGTALQAVETVTFFRPKPGHYLYPGRGLCGQLTVADIGIPESCLTVIAPKLMRNRPEVWHRHWPVMSPEGHKYHRGHLLVYGGARMTGAARLATAAARRAGAGLATILAPEGTDLVYQLGAPGAMVQPLSERQGLLDDPRCNILLIGPGLETGDRTRELVLEACRTGKRLVLDADALSAFQGEPENLLRALPDCSVMTPHEGEFSRLFPDMTGDRLSRARQAAKASGSVIVLKGADTIVASPEDYAVINSNAPPALATAGSGDILAGMISGLICRGMPVFPAAAAGVWLHGEAASRFGPGLIAEDIPDMLPGILAEIEHLTTEV